ncbi:retrovirus-related pol polyprotein LINE-1 [Tanacetum coccineum]
MDRISKLPPAITETILCLVPIEAAARTSVLSKEWRYTWTKIPKLVFNEHMFEVKGEVLKMQRRTIDEFTLEMNTKGSFGNIAWILDCLFEKSVKKLKLKLFRECALPSSLFTWTHLTDPMPNQRFSLFLTKCPTLKTVTMLPYKTNAELDFVKLILARSRTLMKVNIVLYQWAGKDVELQILEVLSSSLHASPTVEIVVEKVEKGDRDVREPGRSTIEAIHLLRSPMEKFRQRDIYKGAKTRVQTTVGNTDFFHVEVGLHQGSVISPYLFALILDELSREIQESIPWCMIFAQDIVLVAESIERLNNILEHLREALEDNGFRKSFPVVAVLAIVFDCVIF